MATQKQHIQLSVVNIISSHFGNTALKPYNPEFSSSKDDVYFLVDEQPFIVGIEAPI